jgi:hypothetical protein
MPSRTRLVAAFLLLVSLESTTMLAAQALAPPLPRWRAQLPAAASRPLLASAATSVAYVPGDSSGHRHTMTGLLIGGLVGTVATGAFLVAFCSDSDTQCGADEVGRAALYIALPAAALGAVIGSLIRTRR